MTDDEKNILIFGNPTGTIEIRPHPEEVIDVAPEILIKMKARLKGEMLENVFDQDERISNEFLLQREKKKLLNIFKIENELFTRFSSLKNVKETKEEFLFEEVDKNLLSKYALNLSQGENVDEIDFYAHFLYGRHLFTKSKRISIKNVLTYVLSFEEMVVFSSIIDTYRNSNFDILHLSKEMIDLNPNLQKLMRENPLSNQMDHLLSWFYGKQL
jgi:hypothetical protein